MSHGGLGASRCSQRPGRAFPRRWHSAAMLLAWRSAVSTACMNPSVAGGRRQGLLGGRGRWRLVSSSRQAESEGGQDPGGVAGVVAAGGGDAGVAAGLEDADGEVAQGGHGLGAAAGADLGGVFAVGDVADVVQGLDAPVAADPGGELGGGGLAGVQAGDGVDGARWTIVRFRSVAGGGA